MTGGAGGLSRAGLSLIFFALQMPFPASGEHLLAPSLELFSETLQGTTQSLGHGQYRFSYDFASADQVLDWFEYPRDGGGGEWEVQDGVLRGQGRLGLRHRIKFQGNFSARVTFVGLPTGRIHLLDQGDGRSGVAMDFRAVYQQGKLFRRIPAPMRRTWSAPAGKRTITIRLIHQQLEVGSGDQTFQAELSSDEMPESGYFGLFCWGKPAQVSQIMLEGEMDSGWAERERARLSAAAAIEAGRGAGRDQSSSMLYAGKYPWPWNGSQPPSLDRRNGLILTAGEEGFETVVGRSHWRNYSVRGWLFLGPGGQVVFTGRTTQRQVRPMGAEVNFSADGVVARVIGGRAENVDAGPKMAGRRIPFRVDFSGQQLRIEKEGLQVLHASMNMPEHGLVRIRLMGAGTQLGGLNIQMIRDQGEE